MNEQTTSSSFTPLLATTDWNEEWKELQKARRAADNVDFWNERAKTFGGEHAERDDISPYVAQFLELANIAPGETVFDMGCGNGALAIPLAQAGHHVIAADFSQGMIDKLHQTSSRLGITDIETKLMSWDDTWEDFGVTPSCADVALASRSLATSDLQDSLIRLSRVARRRVCVTLPTGSSPRTDERILQAIGIQNRLGKDYLYAFMILSNLGYYPEVNYIISERYDTYDDKQEALDHLGKMLADTPRALLDENDIDDALEKLSAWLDDNLVDNKDVGAPGEYGVQKRLKLVVPRVIRWAFITWDVSPES